MVRAPLPLVLAWLVGLTPRWFAVGAEIDDIMCIEENDMLFFSTGRSFKAPSSNKEDAQTQLNDGVAAVVGGYKVSTLLGRGGFGEVRHLWQVGN